MLDEENPETMNNEIFRQRLADELNHLRSQNELLANQVQQLLLTKSRNKVKYEKPKLFNGERNPMVIENWVFSVKEYCEGMQLNGAEAVKVAVSFTDGIAKQFWRNKANGWAANIAALPPYGDPRTDIDAFARFMRERFFPSDYIKRIRDRLDGLKQVTSVKDYVDKFEALLLQIPSEDYHDADMMHKFLRKLKPEIKKLVMVSGPNTLNEAYQQAERIDDIVYASSKENRTDSKPFMKQAPTRKFTDAMEIDAVTFERPNGRNYKGYTSKELKCFNCGKSGHLSGKCPLPPTEKTLAYRAKKSGNGQQHQ